MTGPLGAGTERFAIFECNEDRCVGVVSAPVQGAATGVVIIVGGPQYRVGSHRQFALLARALAEAGFPVLRFDYRGMGDSEGVPRPFDDIGDDIRGAVDAMLRETGVDRVVLWGLCDGASAALLYGHRDPRVAGIVALNPWARSQQGEATAKLRHYYLDRIRSGDFWRKLAKGRFDPRRAAGELAATVRNASGNAASAGAAFLERMEEGWRAFGKPVLFLLSGRDLTAREFEAWTRGARARASLYESGRTKVVAFPDADHTFSDRDSRDAVAAATVQWIRQLPVQ